MVLIIRLFDSVPSLASLRPGLRTALVSVLLFGGTLLLFSRSTGWDFINFDDPSYVTANPRVQGGLSWAGVVWAFTAATDYWHPLTWLSHMLDWQLYGSAASGHHLTSVLWHALNAVLAFFVFRRLTGTFWLSAFAAALFAWHPLRVESVTWVTERKDVMSGCFFLLTLLVYARYVSLRKIGDRAWQSYLLTLVCFVAGLMSKPMLVTLPVVLLMLDFWPFARGGTAAESRFLVVEKLPFFALSAAAAVTTVLMQQKIGAFVLDLPLGARIGNAVVSLARYLGKAVWPSDLIVCYSHPGYWPILTIVAASVLLLALVALAWWQRQARPWIAVGLGWYLVTLLPVIGLIQVGIQAMADRYTYLPLLGIEMALLGSLPTWSSRPWRISGLCGACAVLAVCAWRTWEQEAVWRDSISLFSHAVQSSENNDLAEDLYASALYAAGRFDEAATHAERARALNPKNDKVLATLAALAARQGKVDEAMALYRTALALRPENPMVQCQLGLHEFSRGNVDEARTLMTAALRSLPELLKPTMEIAANARQQGDGRTALFLCEIVLTVAPNNAEAQLGKGVLLIQAGDRARGIAALRRALELDPKIPGLREKLRQLEEK